MITDSPVFEVILNHANGKRSIFYWSNSADSWTQYGKNMLDSTIIEKICEILANKNMLIGSDEVDQTIVEKLSVE